MEFVPFNKIVQIGKLSMSITQKIHGTNAQIVINEYGDVFVGSRNRWITPEDDNYGFARFINDNKEEVINKLGTGIHFGEWAGPGINSGEGLESKTFVLFDWWKFPIERSLPPQMKVVPVLYQGYTDLTQIEIAMTTLKEKGSLLVPDFMRPEGIVVMLGDTRYKKVFQAEETAWKDGDGNKQKLKTLADTIDVSYLLQPIRMEKLLSKDERYVREYPKSLPVICSDYIKDLQDEKQITGSEDEVKIIKKALGKYVFSLARQMVEKE